MDRGGIRCFSCFSWPAAKRIADCAKNRSRTITSTVLRAPSMPGSCWRPFPRRRGGRAQPARSASSATMPRRRAAGAAGRVIGRRHERRLGPGTHRPRLSLDVTFTATATRRQPAAHIDATTAAAPCINTAASAWALGAGGILRLVGDRRTNTACRNATSAPCAQQGLAGLINSVCPSLNRNR